MDKKAKPVSCDICQKRAISTPVSKWCPHCEDGLCNECLEHHGVSRSTARHHIIPIEDYQELPGCVSSVKHRCDVHRAEFELYCPSHGVACCVDCTKDTHSTCADLKPLHEVVKNVKSSNQLQEIERNLTEIVENITKLTAEQEGNITILDEEKQKQVDMIKQVRQTVNDHLDKIESTLMDDLTSTHESSKLEIERLIEKLNERKTRANAIQEEISITKQAASHLQIFIGMRDIEKRVEEESKSLVTLQHDENFYQSDIHITYSEILSAIADRVPIFGEVLLETSPKNLSIILGKRRQSQMILPKMKGIEQIKLRPV